MFLVRFFKASFDFKRVLTRGNEHFGKLIIYFLMLSMISLFPMNLLAVREQGWRLDFIAESFSIATPSWDLPEHCQISISRLVCENDLSVTRTHRGVDYVFNGQASTYDFDRPTLVLNEKEVLYFNGQGAMMVGNYNGFDRPISFRSINLLEGDDRYLAFIDFGNALERSFSPYIIIYSVLTNTVINIGAYALFILLLALVMQLFRFGYSKFINYFQAIKVLIFMMTLPALASFGIGLMVPAFAPVAFQLTMGIVVMLVMLIHGKKTFA